MALQLIGVGTAANDGTGDTLRSAAIKMNENFEELYQGVSKSALVDTTGAIDITFGTIVCTNAGSISLSLADANYSGRTIRVIAENTGNVTVTPTNLSGGTSVVIAQNGVLDLVWGTSSWLIVNNGNTNLTIS